MLTVRHATPADLDELGALFDGFRAFYGKAVESDAGRAFLEARMTSGESLVLIARDATGRAVGYTQIYRLYSSTRMQPAWLLNDLFVADDARGTGVGAAMLAEAERRAREAGACELLLETANDNPARRLYERSGYRHVTDFAFYSLDLTGSGHA